MGLTHYVSILHRIGKIASQACCLCEMHVKTIAHLFYECFITKEFWFNLIEVWNGSHTRRLKINCKSVLVGYNVTQVMAVKL